MIIGIDAHNIRGNGGSLIHLMELLVNSDPKEHKFEKIIVWVTKETAEKLPIKNHIEYKIIKFNYFFSSFFWQIFKLGKEAKLLNCSVLFFPGGIYLGNFKPFIAFAQSMLPFDEKGQSFYQGSIFYYILKIKKILMLYTFKRSSGVIFVSNALRKKIEKFLKNTKVNGVVIHHGVNKMFASQRTRKFMEDGILRLVTFSSHALHKNLTPLCNAVSDFRKEGNAVEIQIIGPEAKYGTNKLYNYLDQIDPKREMVKIITNEKYENLPKYLNDSDTFIAASSCESFGLPLKEALVNQIPILYFENNSFEEIIKDCNPTSIITLFKNFENDLGLKIRYIFENQKKNLEFDIDEKRYWANSVNVLFHYLCKRET